MGPRSLAVALAVVAAVATIPASTAAPPKEGGFVPSRSLGGIALGMTKAEVLKAWGKQHGVCRGCPKTTWYFNYRPFEPQGTGVVFAGGGVAHVFTLWRPTGWKSREGLALGADASEVSRLYGSLDKRRCTFYEALLLPGKRAQSVFYVFRGKVWGFGLTRPNASPCL